MQYDIKYLIAAYLTRSLSEEERGDLEGWLMEEEHRVLFNRICHAVTLEEKMERMRGYDREQAWLRLERKIKPRRFLWRGWRYAAVLALPALVAGGLLYGVMGGSEGKEERVVAQAEQAEVTGPCIILADGEVVALRQEGKCAVETREGIRLEQEDGKVTLVVPELREGEEVRWHTVVTPRGGVYHVELPDGTKVWLNAESSLRFPSAFAGGDRMVEMKGEGYFEVVHDEGRPFVVTAGEMKVNVLGTKFNVCAYPEGRHTTALLEGKVQVESGNAQAVLAPGEQAVADGDRLVTGKANMGAVLSWMNRTFVFENAPLEEIMAELGRWYDVEVVFLNNRLREERFSIEMPRYKSAVEAVRAIERTKSIQLEVTEGHVVVK